MEYCADVPRFLPYTEGPFHPETVVSRHFDSELISCTLFFGELYLKGVTEATTDLVVSDGANGLESALEHPRSGVAPQRCMFHTITQLADQVVSKVRRLVALRQSREKKALAAQAPPVG